MAFKNYYEVLGVSSGASVDEIREAYREMASKYKNANNTLDEYSQLMLGNINEAVEVLTNPQKKADYDKTLLMIDEGAKAAAVHSNISSGDMARINDLTERFFEQEKYVSQKHQQFLAAQNAKPAAYFTSLKVIVCLLLIGGSFYYFHPEYFDFVKGTPVEEQRSYEWYTKDSTLIYAKPKKKAKIVWGVPANTGFNIISEHTYHMKITYTDKDGKSREGYIKKEDLEKNNDPFLQR